MGPVRYISPEQLGEIEASIETALDKRQKSLLGALYRIQGSASGWCNHPTCGHCALAQMRCVNGLDERLDELIAEHHGDAHEIASAGSDTGRTPRKDCLY